MCIRSMWHLVTHRAHAHLFPTLYACILYFENEIQLQHVQVKFSERLLCLRVENWATLFTHTHIVLNTEFDMHVFRDIQILGLHRACVSQLQANQYCYFANSKYIKMKLDESERKKKKRHPIFFTLAEFVCLSVGPIMSECVCTCVFFSLLVSLLFQLSHRKTQIRPSIGKYT